MCGIAGIKRMGDEPITWEEVTVLLLASQNRGNHATGIATENNGRINVLKKDIPAWQFTQSIEYNTFLEENLQDDTNTVILHTRFATKGDPWKNDNNHPIFKDKVAVVHNGGISNDDELFKEFGPRNCETDSDIIRGILDESGFTHKGVRDLCRMTGSAAIAAVQAEAPGMLLLARSGNPIIIAGTDRKIYWASEQQAIQKAARPWSKQFGIFMRPLSKPDFGYISMPDHTAYLIGPDGLQWRQEFNVFRGKSFTGPTYRVWDSYNSKKNAWKAAQAREEKDKRALSIVPKSHNSSVTVIAPGGSITEAAACNCGQRVVKTDGKKSWADYYCPDCKSGLGFLEAD